MYVLHPSDTAISLTCKRTKQLERMSGGIMEEGREQEQKQDWLRVGTRQRQRNECRYYVDIRL